MGMDFVWAVRMNYFTFVVKRLADRLVSTPRNTFSPDCIGRSVKNKLDDYWIPVQRCYNDSGSRTD